MVFLLACGKITPCESNPPVAFSCELPQITHYLLLFTH